MYSQREPETLTNPLDLPPVAGSVRRTIKFNYAIGFDVSNLAQIDTQGMRAHPRHFGEVEGASLSYWSMSPDDPRVNDDDWVFRGSNAPELRSAWQQGLGRPSISSQPEASIVLPNTEAVESVFTRGGKMLLDHLLDDIQVGAGNRVFFSYVDPFFNHIRVTTAEPT